MTNWEKEFKNQFSCLCAVYKEVNGKEKMMMPEAIQFITKLLASERTKLLEDIAKKAEKFDVNGGGSGRRLKIQLLDYINSLK